MKKQGYKANRPSLEEQERRFQEGRLKYIEKKEEQRRLANERRIAKGLPPKEYRPINRPAPPLSSEENEDNLNG